MACNITRFGHRPSVWTPHGTCSRITLGQNTSASLGDSPVGRPFVDRHWALRRGQPSAAHFAFARRLARRLAALHRLPIRFARANQSRARLPAARGMVAGRPWLPAETRPRRWRVRCRARRLASCPSQTARNVFARSPWVRAEIRPLADGQDRSPDRRVPARNVFAVAVGFAQRPRLAQTADNVRADRRSARLPTARDVFSFPQRPSLAQTLGYGFSAPPPARDTDSRSGCRCAPSSSGHRTCPA